ncbi:ABC transporter permease [Pseudobutyrivibrio sp.]
MNYGIRQYIFVIRQLTAREITRKYARSFLGIIWSVLNPLLFMIVMSIVFSGFSTNRTMYPVYYVTGFTLWSMFNTATTTSMTAFEDNKNLFQKTKLPREIFVLSRDYTALVNLGFSCIALLIVLAVFRVRLNWTVIIFVVDVFFEMLFSIGVSFILATIYVFYKDIKFLWRNFIVLLVHMVAVYIPIERYPESLHEITRLNPLYFYPNIARRCVLEGSVDVQELKLMVIWGVGMLLVGLLVFKYKENDIVKKL